MQQMIIIFEQYKILIYSPFTFILLFPIIESTKFDTIIFPHFPSFCPFFKGHIQSISPSAAFFGPKSIWPILAKSSDAHITPPPFLALYNAMPSPKLAHFSNPNPFPLIKIPLEMPPPFLLMFSTFFCCFGLFFVAVSSVELPPFQRIPDAEVEEDMKAVERAIQSPWVEQFPSGVKRLATKRENFSLTEAQKALFSRHWELETIQREKPTRPKQFDLEMFADALKIMLEMDKEKKAVLIWPHKLREWMEAERMRGGEEKKMPLAEEEAKKSAQLTNLVGNKEGEEGAADEGEGEGEGQCSEADKPAEIVLAEQQAKMANAIASNQTMVAQQMPMPSTIDQQPPSMAPSPIQSAIQQGNYVVNGLDDFGRPVMLILPNNFGGNGLEAAKLGETIQIHGEELPQNIAQNQQKQPIMLNDGSKIYVVEEGQEMAENNGKGGNEVGQQEKVADREECNEADETKKEEKNEAEKEEEEEIGKDEEEEEIDGNKERKEGNLDDENEKEEGKKEGKLNEGEEEAKKEGKDYEKEEGKKGDDDEEKTEEDEKAMKNEKSSEEGGNERTIFEAIRGQKKNEDKVKEKEDGNGDEGQILIIDWAKGGNEKEDDEEGDEGSGDNVAAIGKRLGAMKMIKVGEEANSTEKEEEEKVPKSNSANATVVEVEVIKPNEMREKPGFLTILSDMLFARKKRDVIVMEAESGAESPPTMPSSPIPTIILEGTKLEEQMPTKMPFKMPIAPAGVFANETISANDGEKEEAEEKEECCEEVEKKNVENDGKTIKMVRSFKGQMDLGKGQFGIEAKWEMTMNAPFKQQKQVEEVKKETGVEVVHQERESNQNPGEGVLEKETYQNQKEEDENEEEEFQKVEEKQPKNEEKVIEVKVGDEKAQLIEYLEWYLVKTGGRKRDEKLAYVLYSELQYWLAKQIEKKCIACNRNGMNKILGEAYLQAKWSKTIEKLAILTEWIGKDFRKK